MSFGDRLRQLSVVLFVALGLQLLFTPLAGAQYGGISGLFVTTSPDRPGFADFSGLGCAGGQQVILYFPGLAPQATDPVGSQPVPGRVLAVATTTTSADPLLSGTFNFPNIELPDVAPGVYEVHARCANLDLRVLIQIDAAGSVTLDPGTGSPIENETPGTSADGSSPPAGTLPLTGRNSDRVVSLAVGVVAMGVALVALSRRQLALAPAVQSKSGSFDS